MTESVTSPRPRSRSSRASARSRQRSAAAAGGTSARATARPGGDASRDELTLDLFGDPVFAPGGAAASRDDAVEDVAAIEVADDVVAGRQPALDGFGTPEIASAAGEGDAERAVKPGADDEPPRDAQPAGAGTAAGVSAPEGGGVAPVGAVDVAGSASTTGDASAAAAAAEKAGHAPVQADAMAPAGGIDSATTGREAAKPGDEVAAGDAIVRSGEGRPSGDAVKARRTLSGGKRRAVADAREATAPFAPASAIAGTGSDAVESLKPVQDAAASAEGQATVQPVEPVATVGTSDAALPVMAATPTPPVAQPVAQPVASAAAFVTKPSADHVQPAVEASAAPAIDPDSQLRPLSDRLAALQAETAGLARAADREMRRVNRLLLALAVVVLAGLVALVMQTRQIAHLKQEVAAKQLRIDRLAADLSTQQATVMTLEEHHEALLSQVDRLQRNANREAVAAKRTRRAR